MSLVPETSQDGFKMYRDFRANRPDVRATGGQKLFAKIICVTVSNIFSKEIIFNNTKCRK